MFDSYESMKMSKANLEYQQGLESSKKALFSDNSQLAAAVDAAMADATNKVRQCRGNNGRGPFVTADFTFSSFTIAVGCLSTCSFVLPSPSHTHAR